MDTVIIIGASTNPDRYSYKAFYKLLESGYSVIPVNPAGGVLEDIEFVRDLSHIQGPVHAITVYVREQTVLKYLEKIKALSPEKVILNPGTEGEIIERALYDNNISYSKACTLVLLSTGQMEKIIARETDIPDA